MMSQIEDSPKLKYSFLTIIFCLFLCVLFRTAWISDDAMISLKVVVNTLCGYGPNFNIDERVQAYTHPLWFLLLLFFSYFTDIWYATYGLSFVFAIASVLLLLKISSRQPLFFIVILSIGLLFSKTFADYSTSGLENPLSNFLLILLCYLWIKLDTNGTFEKKNIRNIVLINFISCLLLLNRMDHVLFAIPILCYIGFKCIFNHNYKILLVSLLSFVPFLLWECFSFWYYGQLFPNTAYSKLNTGITRLDYIHQGLSYFVRLIADDPIVFVFFIFSFLSLSLRIVRNNIKTLILICSLFIYLLYVISIGGDFMDGRFFCAPFVISMFIYCISIESIKSINLSKKIRLLILVVIIAIGAKNLYPNLIAGSNYMDQYIDENGIANERGYWYQANGLLANLNKKSKISPFEFYYANDLKITSVAVAGGGLGRIALQSSPAIHFVDIYALTDPLLSKLPITNPKDFRIGHFRRFLPDDYISSIRLDQNIIYDNTLHNIYDRIRQITRGDLFSFDRFKFLLKNLYESTNSTNKPIVFYDGINHDIYKINYSSNEGYRYFFDGIYI